MEEVIKGRFNFNIIHYKSGLKVDFWLVKRDFWKVRAEKKIKEKDLWPKIFLISPEDLILNKLLSYKEI